MSIVNAVEGLSRRCDKVARILLVPVVLGMFFVIMTGVVSRYLINRQLTGTFELSRILFMWAWLLASTIALKSKVHIGYEFLVRRLSERMKSIALLIGYAVALWFFYILSVEGVGMLGNALSQKMPALGISMLWIHLPIPIAALLMGIHTVADVVKTIGGLCTQKEATS